MNYKVGIVSEGPTDFEVITNLFTKIKPGSHNFLPIQPNLSQTEGLGEKLSNTHGNGWKGVLSWCKSVSEEFEINELLDHLAIDLLIIQLDADVSREPEVNCARPCPDAENTVRELEELLARHLGVECLGGRILSCIPSDNTEAWALVAFDKLLNYHGTGKFVECVHKPDDILSKPPFNILPRKNGKPKKNQVRYRQHVVPVITEQWDYIRQQCSQAEKLHQNLANFS